MITMNARIDLAIAIGRYSTEPDDLIWSEVIVDRMCHVDSAQMLSNKHRDAFVRRPDGKEAVAEIRVLLPVSPTLYYTGTFLNFKDHRCLGRLNNSDAMYYMMSIKKIDQLYMSLFGLRYDKQNLTWA